MGLRQIVGEFGDKKANGCPPWDSYRGLMLGCLIDLGKCHGVRTFSLGETWCWMFAKCVLVIMGAEAKEA